MSAPINIPGKETLPEDNGLAKMIADAKALLPLNLFRRMIAASLNDPSVDKALKQRGHEPEKLRSDFQRRGFGHGDKVNNRIDLTYTPGYNQELHEAIVERVKPSREGYFAIELDMDYWGDGWPGSITPDITTIITTRFMIITLKYADDGQPVPRVRFLEVVTTEMDWYAHETSMEYKFIAAPVTIDLYELCVLMPAIYERLSLSVGGPREFLAILKAIAVEEQN